MKYDFLLLVKFKIMPYQLPGCRCGYFLNKLFRQLSLFRRIILPPVGFMDPKGMNLVNTNGFILFLSLFIIQKGQDVVHRLIPFGTVMFVKYGQGGQFLNGLNGIIVPLCIFVPFALTRQIQIQMFIWKWNTIRGVDVPTPRGKPCGIVGMPLQPILDLLRRGIMLCHQFVRQMKPCHNVIEWIAE